jgi:hypothetical protein
MILNDWSTAIVHGTARRVLVPLDTLGIFAQDKSIPLSHAPITLELELANPEDVVADTGRAYTIDSAWIQCDLLRVAPELQARYEQVLASGNINLPITTYSTTRHILDAAAKQDVATTRSLALLKTAILTFSTTTAAHLPTANAVNQKDVNLFANPNHADTAWTHDTDSFSWQLVIDGCCWPVYPCSGSKETWMHLRQALDLSSYGYMDIVQADWRKTKFIVAIDLERAASTLHGASFTGWPCRGGSPIMFRLNNIPQTHKVEIAFITLVHDAVISISSAGCDYLV